MGKKKQYMNLDLPIDGRVYVVDAKHQFFNGHVYNKAPKGDYSRSVDGKAHKLHGDVYEFYNGKIPEGYIIHHTHRNPDGSFDKNENNIEWLQMMTHSEHSTLHNNLKQPTEKFCAWCGNRFTTTAHSKLCCSDTCTKARINYNDKKRRKEKQGLVEKNINSVSVVDTVNTDPVVANSEEGGTELRICPICSKTFRINISRRQYTCGDPKCTWTAYRVSRARLHVEKMQNRRNNGTKLFTNKELGVKIRGLLINGEPWFVAKDVCKALDIKNPSQAVARLDDDEKRIVNVAANTLISTYGNKNDAANTVISTDGNKNASKRGNPNMNVVNEFGLYRLILESRKPTAKLFKRWIIREVLPSLRKMSMYLSTEPMPALEAPTVDVPAAVAEPAQLTLDIEPVQSK